MNATLELIISTLVPVFLAGGVGGLLSWRLASRKQAAMLGPEREAVITEAATRATTALRESLETLRRENDGLRQERDALLERIATLEGQVDVLRTQIARNQDSTNRDGILGAILGASPDGVIVVNHLGVIEFANVAAARMFAWPVGSLEGLPLSALIPERFRAAHRLHRAEYQAEPRLRPMGLDKELRGRRSDGSEFPVEVGLAPLERAGQPSATVAVIRDMTDQRHLGEAPHEL